MGQTQGQDHGHDRKAFRALLLASSSGKVADQLTNARTALPWLLDSLGAPAYFLGWMVPLRESLSMLPQIVLAPWINSRSRRKGIWIAAALLQALCLMMMPLSLLMPSALAGAWWIVGLLAIFSLARCFCSITFKDLMGKMVVQSRRGRLSGYAEGLAGVMVVLTALVLLLVGDDTPGALPVALVFILAGLLWVVGACWVGGLQEARGEAQPMQGVWRQALGNFQLLVDDDKLRLLVLSRALLLCPILGAPYLVALADAAGSLSLLGGLILLNGLASSLSSPAWGHLADHSSRACLLLGGITASISLSLGGLLALEWFSLPGGRSGWLLLCFTLLSVGHSGIRTGRKTYVTNMAEGATRTRYVSASNSMIGLVLLAVGLFTSPLASYSMPLLVLLLAVTGMTGCAVVLAMPRVEGH